jgi:hypothetical protein
MCMQNVILSMIFNENLIKQGSKKVCCYKELEKTGSKGKLKLPIIDNICIKCILLEYQNKNYLINEYFADQILIGQYNIYESFFQLVLNKHFFECNGLNGRKYSINKIIEDQYYHWKVFSNNVESSGCKNEEVCWFECNKEGQYAFNISSGVRHICGAKEKQ